ncbi:MAG: hypothetical protein HUJ26_11885 [Planctomycetaceae bacterium]|nr:hypothetical protein [Planctomycetaceae bacterium]
MVEKSRPQQPEKTPASGSRKSRILWCLSTIAGTACLSMLAGSTNYSVKYLVIAPFLLGGFTAAGALRLLITFGLQHEMKQWMIGWIVLLAIGVTMGTTTMAWSRWKNDLQKEHLKLMSQIRTRGEDAQNQESAQQARKQLLLSFRKQSSFKQFLSHRLDSFRQSISRRTPWKSPIPELVFLGEQFVAAVAALFLSLTAYHGEGELFRKGQSS